MSLPRKSKFPPASGGPVLAGGSEQLTIAFLPSQLIGLEQLRQEQLCNQADTRALFFAHGDELAAPAWVKVVIARDRHEA